MNMTMPRVVTDIDSDLKRWLQIHALDTGKTMSEIVAALIQEYHDRVEQTDSTKTK